MDKILGYLAMSYIFLPWRPIVVLVAAILFVWMASWIGAWIVLPA